MKKLNESKCLKLNYIKKYSNVKVNISENFELILEKQVNGLFIYFILYEIIVC